jgi:hypothetical protein
MSPRSLVLALLALPLLSWGQVVEVGLVAGHPTQSGAITDGTISPSVARFSAPTGIAFNAAGRLLVVDTAAPSVRLVSLVGGGAVSTLATGFLAPQGVSVESGGSIFVADTQRHQIKKILSDDANPPVTVIAGTGFAGTSDNPAEFDSPRGIALAPGNPSLAFVCDTNNHTVRKVNLTTGEVITLAGQAGVSGSRDGTGSAARFNLPSALVVTQDEVVYVADTGNHAIRKITSAGVVTTLAGEKGTSGFRDKTLQSTTLARFSSPWGMVFDASGALLVCDSANHVIRKVTTAGVVSTIAGNPSQAGFKNATSGRQALFNNPRGICRGQVGSTAVFYIADTGNKCIRSLNTTIPGPTITSHPIGVALKVGATATFKVTATRPANTLPLVYQWRKDGAELPGETNSTLTIANVQAANQGAYSVIVAVPGGEALVSHPAPLVITGRQTWLWPSRFGSTGVDAVQGLVLRENTTRGTALWASGFSGGHVLKRISPLTGLPTFSSVLSSKGDGAHDLAIDSEAGLFVGMDRGVIQDTYGLLTRHSAAGARTWALDLGRRVVPSTTTAVTDVFAVDLTPEGKPCIGGEFSGFVSFPSRGANPGTALRLGSASRVRKSGLIGKLDRDGKVEWVRELYSTATDRGDTRVTGLVCDEDGAVYVCGHIGPNARIMRTADSADLELLTNTADSTGFVMKYDAAGTFLWAHLAAVDSDYSSISLDTAGNPWVTGYQTSPLQAALRELDPSTGAVVSEVLAANARGTSVTFHPTLGIGWLLADPAGLLQVLGRSFPGVPGYRVLKLNSTTLGPVWDLPVFGSLTSMPISDQADLLFGSDGRLFASLNFLEEDRPRSVVDFSGRGQVLMKGRRQDGFVAIISELPEVGVQPLSQILAKGSTATFAVTATGELPPSFQWYKASAALSGKNTNTLTLPNIALTTAGVYSVKLKNGRDTLTSQSAQLAVVDTAAKTVTKAAGSTVTLTVATAGTGLSYLWHKNGSPIDPDVPGVRTGTRSKTLTLQKITINEAGTYTCEVKSAPAGGTTLFGGANTLVVP